VRREPHGSDAAAVASGVGEQPDDDEEVVEGEIVDEGGAS